MKDRFLRLAQKEHGPVQRLVTLFFGGLVFLFLLPWALVRFSLWLDDLLHLPSLDFAPWATVIGWVMVVFGFLFAMWAVVVQFTIGRGTPIPVGRYTKIDHTPALLLLP